MKMQWRTEELAVHWTLSLMEQTLLGHSTGAMAALHEEGQRSAH
jgi:hypothetical protein